MRRLGRARRVNSRDDSHTSHPCCSLPAMSVLSSLSRRTSLCLSSPRLPIPSSTLNAFPVLQTRSKAGGMTKKKPAPKQQQGRRSAPP